MGTVFMYVPAHALIWTTQLQEGTGLLPNFSPWQKQFTFLFTKYGSSHQMLVSISAVVIHMEDLGFGLLMTLYS